MSKVISVNDEGTYPIVTIELQCFRNWSIICDCPIYVDCWKAYCKKKGIKGRPIAIQDEKGIHLRFESEEEMIT